MKIFQLDECLNSKRLAEACNSEGRCSAHRFPNRYKGRSVKDPEVLVLFFSNGKAIVTNDGNMLTDHADDIPEVHPGLVVVAFSPDNREEITDRASAMILSKFKQAVTDWSDLPCQNSVLRITERSVTVSHKEADVLRQDLYLEYRTEGFANLLADVLARNAARGPDSEGQIPAIAT